MHRLDKISFHILRSRSVALHDGSGDADRTQNRWGSACYRWYRGTVWKELPIRKSHLFQVNLTFRQCDTSECDRWDPAESWIFDHNPRRYKRTASLLDGNANAAKDETTECMTCRRLHKDTGAAVLTSDDFRLVLMSKLSGFVQMFQQLRWFSACSCAFRRSDRWDWERTGMWWGIAHRKSSARSCDGPVAETDGRNCAWN